MSISIVTGSCAAGWALAKLAAARFPRLLGYMPKSLHTARTFCCVFSATQLLPLSTRLMVATLKLVACAAFLRLICYVSPSTTGIVPPGKMFVNCYLHRILTRTIQPTCLSACRS